MTKCNMINNGRASRRVKENQNDILKLKLQDEVGKAVDDPQTAFE